METHNISGNKITIKDDPFSRDSTDIEQNKESANGRSSTKIQQGSPVSLEAIRLETNDEETTQNNQDSLKYKTNSHNDQFRNAIIEMELIDKKLVCEICQEILNQNKMTSFGCEHYLCKLCMKNYIIEKVKKHTVPFCIQENCACFLNLYSKEFLELPGKIQEKYKCIFQNVSITGTSHLGKSPTFNEGDDEKSVSHIERNEKIQQEGSKYRKCSKCNLISSKINEEMKVECECGTHFCYLCGKRWASSGHNCKYLKALKNLYSSEEKKQPSEKENAPRSPLKRLLVALLWIPLFLFVLLPKAVLFFMVLIVMSWIAGMSFYSVSYIINLDKTYKKVLLMIFFPLAMILGIGMAWTIFFNGFIMEEIEFYESMKSCLVSL